MVRSRAFDCIVLGAGAAGLAAARGLSLRYPDARIAVIEQGTFPRTYTSRFLGPSFLRRYPFMQRVPLLQPFLASTPLGRYCCPSLFREYLSKEESGLEQGRGLHYLSAQGVGGSTLLCDMKAVRPTQKDCEKWGPGWSWDELFPFFHETVRCVGDPSEVLVQREGGENSPQPLGVARRAERSVVDAGLNVRFYEACEAVGISPSASFNQGTADGFSFYESLVTRGKHERGLLHPEVSMSIAENTANADDKQNGIILFLNMKAERVIMEGGHRVKQVECSCVNTGSAQVIQGKHIVVTLGALESPAFLLRSGIGPQGHVADIPAVGENLIASTSVSTGFSMKSDPTTNAMMPKSLHWRHARYLYRQWREFKEYGAGIFSTLCEGGAFLPSNPEVTEAPDLSIDFYRQPMVLPGEASKLRSLSRLLRPLELSFVCTHHYPRSRGSVRLAPSTDSTSSSSFSNGKGGREGIWHISRGQNKRENTGLEVKFGIFSDEENYDIQRMDNGLEWISRLTSPILPSVFYSDEHQKPVSPFYHLQLRMTRPNKSLTTEEVHKYLKQHTVVSCGSLYGTCALGSVVNTADLSVKGIEGLHVADASVIPTPTVASSWLASAAIGARIPTFF